MEHVKVELQTKPPLERDTTTIKNLVQDFHRSNQDWPRQNTADETANSVVGFLGLFFMGYHSFHNPNTFTLEMKKKYGSNGGHDLSCVKSMKKQRTTTTQHSTQNYFVESESRTN